MDTNAKQNVKTVVFFFVITIFSSQGGQAGRGREMKAHKASAMGSMDIGI